MESTHVPEESSLEEYERLAIALADAYTRGDRDVIRELNWTQGTAFVWDHDPVEMQRRLPTWFAAVERTPELALADARRLVAVACGLQTWEELAASHSAPSPDPRSAPVFIARTPPFYRVDWSENRLEVRGPRSTKDWERVFALMREQGITRLEAGALHDGVMPLLAGLDHVTELQIEGGPGLTDSGIAQLARMPSLEELTLGGPKSPVTARGLAFLRHLPALRRFQCCWAPGVTDEGLDVFSGCHLLEEVNLMGTYAGDGAIAALAGLPRLRTLSTGRAVTDAGVAMLHELPVFRRWQGDESDYGLMSFSGGPSHLLLDGSFTDEGLTALAGLEGLSSLSFFWHCSALTPAGLEVLRELPRLGFLGCQDSLCDDAAMGVIAEIPNLRMLMGQGAVATDDGFTALSRSQSLEYFWGRECPNLGSAGFAALAALPALRGLAVSLENVDDQALAMLPAFPALRELVAMGLSDAGFRHVSACADLEALWCMYCPDTGDAATEHLARLHRLKQYYAGGTRITDRSLEVLSRLPSLERLEFWACNALTDAGVRLLASLPELKELRLDGLQGVTPAVIDSFPETVKVKYSG